MSEFDDIDLSMLDSEFNLELLFEEDSTEQVVSEIEELIAEEESEVPDASIPDNEQQLIDNNYVIVPNFISKERADN